MYHISESKLQIYCRISIHIYLYCIYANVEGEIIGFDSTDYLASFRQRSKCQDQRALEMMNNRSFVMPQLATVTQVCFEYILIKCLTHHSDWIGLYLLGRLFVQFCLNRTVHH